jgi:xanthine phosphoribosyltransferase
MPVMPLDEVQRRLKALHFDESFDLIVAVARGGIIPAVMLQFVLGCDLEWIWLNFRDDQQNPIRPRPELIKPLGFDPAGKTILLVDDRSRTGSTLNRAKEELAGAALIKTLVVNGEADYRLFDDDCFYFPWRMDISPD